MSVQVTPLRQRMIGDMTIRNMSPLTKKSYVRAVKNFSKFFRQSPDKLTFEDVRIYQLHLVSRGLGVQAINQIMCALRFFYGTTLGKTGVSEHIPLGRRPDTLPPILARDEVERFLKAVNARPQNFLFPGADPARPITVRSLQRACRLAAEVAGLDKTVTVHTLRHSFATHLLEQGVDIRVIQDLLGHRHIDSTSRYARVAINTIRQIKSPLEALNIAKPPPA
jgi:site-specific recombinase XerD